MSLNDTIVAPATPFGYGGLAVVRISGDRAFMILASLTDRNNGHPFTHKAVIRTSLFTKNGVPFDDALVTVFQTPNSYTGEDLAEISCHGSPAIVEEIVATARHYGARIADPGEFTKRAFLNGKIDLTQAEAVADIIHGKTVESAVLNYKVLQGDLSKRLAQIKSGVVDCLSLTEFELDISEEDSDPDLPGVIKNKISSLLDEIGSLLDSYQQGRLLNRGAMVVIVGKPNVGKSTLLNTLSKTDRAITHHQPGTTRDVVDVSIVLGGAPVRLVDTAGIRISDEAVENEGIRRAKKYIQEADLVLSVIDDPEDDFYAIDGKPCLRVLNKTDCLKAPVNRKGVLPISAKEKTGLDSLFGEIKNALGVTKALSDNALLTSARQRDILTQCQKSVAEAGNLVTDKALPLEIVSMELREALDAIDRILGKTTADDILNNIFGNFCVGK